MQPPTPHIPDRPAKFFAIIWRAMSIQGYQPLDNGHDSVEDACREVEWYMCAEARGSEYGPYNDNAFAPMPVTEIRKMEWRNGRCEVWTLTLRDLPENFTSNLRKIWMDNIPENHPDRAQSA